jgi:protein TonB
VRLLKVLKFVVSVSFASGATLGLLYVMQALIEGGQKAITKVDSIIIVDVVRVKQNRELFVKQRKIEKPPPPDELPPTPPQRFDVAVNKTDYHITDVNLSQDVDIGKMDYGLSDSEYLPIVKVQPGYPMRALAKGMIGWVLVEFTVSDQGAVRSPFVVANCAKVSLNDMDAESCQDHPNKIFDQVSLKAALKFKYKPKTVDGRPIDTMGVQNIFTFVLMD